jgi:hypothetical protein
MTSADTPPDVRGPRFLEPLPYASASETANLRWIIRMLSLLMMGHAVAGISAVAQPIIARLTVPGMSAYPLWVYALQLPTLILCGVAAVFLFQMRRGAFVAVTVACSWLVLKQLAMPIVLIVQQLVFASRGTSASTYLPMTMVSSGFGVVTICLEAVAIILIIARCRKAGALD